MSAIRWLYARLGQMFCFTVGGGMLLLVFVSEYAEQNPIGKAVAGAAFLAAGLALRAMRR